MEAQSSTVDLSRDETARSWISRAASIRLLTVAAFLLGAMVLLADRPFSHAESGDDAIYDYIAQSIVRGQMPYRDVIDPKTPASMYLSAAAMRLGRSVGMREIIAVRWLHVLLMGLLASTTCLVAYTYFRSRAAAVLAVLITLTVNGFTWLMIRGTQPKLPMILFGLLALLLIGKDKPLLAGFFSMLSCLCWQPGLLFTGVTVLIFSRYLTSWRDLRALRVVIGAAVPLTAMLLYFYLRGALGDLWSWTVVYPFGTFAPESSQPLSKAIDNFWKMLRTDLQSDWIIAPLALLGVVLYAAGRVRRRINRETLRSADLYRDALVLPPVIYLAFCMLNFQGGPDLIPFFPFIGLFSAWLFFEAIRPLTRRWPQWKIPVMAIASAIILVLMFVRGTTYGRVKGTLQDQDREAQLLAGYLGPDDKIYVHGAAEILVLLGRPNLNKYIALDTGADNYIAAQKPGGFRDVIGEIEKEAPKIIAITRLRNVRHREEIESWVDEHYERIDFATLRGVYIRKPENQ